LAWNGGGISNYSRIIDNGGHKAAQIEDDSPIVIPDMGLSLPDVEEIKQAVKQAGKDLEVSTSKFAEKVGKMTHEIEDFVAEEISDFIKELPNMK
jgi:cerevisin